MGNGKMNSEELQSVFLTNREKSLLPLLNLRPIQFIVFVILFTAKICVFFDGSFIFASNTPTITQL